VDSSSERRGWRNWGTKAALAVGNVDESRSQRPDEHLLTGDTASKVRAAALAKYPGRDHPAGRDRLRRRHEAHLTTSGGKRVTVEVDKSFRVTGEEPGPGRP
jgi:hypothetical protein